ncbi:MAG: hypothetical protein K8S54_18360 [Spirochaetia bacterium]|nr:hypothetical protein [Spirochaetia bacterium]
MALVDLVILRLDPYQIQPEFCCVCDTRIESNEYGHGPRPICERCSTRVKCVSCGIPIFQLEPHQKIDAGIRACNSCLPDLVVHAPMLGRLFRIALIAVDTALSIRIQNLKEVKLVSRSEVIRHGRRARLDQGGSPLDIAATASQNGTILVRRGERRDSAFGILCHEIGHMWQYENWANVDALDPVIREGFCEWVALHGLLQHGYETQARKRLARRDRIYGAGLRYFVELAKVVPEWEILNGQVHFPHFLGRVKERYSPG